MKLGKKTKFIKILLISNGGHLEQQRTCTFGLNLISSVET